MGSETRKPGPGRMTSAHDRGTERPASPAANLGEDRGSGPRQRAVTITGDAGQAFAALAAEALSPPAGDTMPIDHSTAAARILSEPFPTVDARAALPAGPQRTVRPTRPKVGPYHVAAAARTASSLTQEQWVRRYQRLRLGPVSLNRSLEVSRKITVGDLRRGGMRLPKNLPDQARLRDVPLLVGYIGAGFLVTFDAYGELYDVTVGAGNGAHGVHTWVVQAITDLPAETGDGRQPMPGVFVATANQYAVVDTYGKDAGRIAVRDGRYGAKLDLTTTEKTAWSRARSGKIMLAVVSPSFWRRLGKGDTLLRGSAQVVRALTMAVDRGYVMKALGPRIDSLGGGRIVLESAKTIIGSLLHVPLPGEVEGQIDTTLRQVIATKMAMSSAVNVEADLDVVARALAPEIADLVTGALTGAAAKAGSAVRGRQSRHTAEEGPHTATGRQLTEHTAGPEHSAATHPAGPHPIIGAQHPTAAEHPAGVDPSTKSAHDLRHLASTARPSPGHPDPAQRATSDEGAAAPRRRWIPGTPVPPLSPTRLVGDLGHDGYAAVQHEAERLAAGKSDTVQAANGLRGFILEQYAIRDPQLQALLTRVRALARRHPELHVDPDSIRIDTTITDAVNDGRGQLLDLSIVGDRIPGAPRPASRLGENVDGRPEVVFFLAGEVKVGKQAGRATDQLERSKARLETGDSTYGRQQGIKIGGIQHGVDQVLTLTDFGHRLHMAVVLPADVSVGIVRNLETALRLKKWSFSVIRTSVGDAEMQPIALEMIRGRRARSTEGADRTATPR